MLDALRAELPRVHQAIAIEPVGVALAAALEQSGSIAVQGSGEALGQPPFEHDLTGPEGVTVDALPAGEIGVGGASARERINSGLGAQQSRGDQQATDGRGQ